MSRYRAETFESEHGWHYRILEGDREVVSSGPFLHRSDAMIVGSHFASDNDLEVNLRRR